MDACGPFEATNQIPPAGQPCTTSILSVVASPAVIGAMVMCFSITSTQSILNGAATILLLGRQPRVVAKEQADVFHG